MFFIGMDFVACSLLSKSLIYNVFIFFLLLLKLRFKLLLITSQPSVAYNKKSHTYEGGGAYLQIYFWHLLMNVKNLILPFYPTPLKTPKIKLFKNDIICPTNNFEN